MSDRTDPWVEPLEVFKTLLVVVILILCGAGLAVMQQLVNAKKETQAQCVAIEARVTKLEADVGHLGSRIDKQRECMCSLRRPGDVKDIQPPYGEKK